MHRCRDSVHVHAWPAQVEGACDAECPILWDRPSPPFERPSPASERLSPSWGPLIPSPTPQAAPPQGHGMRRSLSKHGSWNEGRCGTHVGLSCAQTLRPCFIWAGCTLVAGCTAQPEQVCARHAVHPRHAVHAPHAVQAQKHVLHRHS